MTSLLRKVFWHLKSKITGYVLRKNSMDKQQLLPPSGLINEPGYYICNTDLIFNNQDIGILINADNVTLDLNGHSLSYEGVPSTKNKAILASRKKNITIKNGRLHHFYSGITATGANTLIIENIVMENIRYVGINAQGTNITIQHNWIKNMDFSFPRPAADFYVIGINILGNVGTLINNKIEMHIPDNVDSLELVGILIGTNSKNLSIITNILHNNLSRHKKSYAIWVGKEAQAAIIGNIITNYFYDMAGAGTSSLYFSNNKINNDNEYIKFHKTVILETMFHSSSHAEIEAIKSYFQRLTDIHSD